MEDTYIEQTSKKTIFTTLLIIFFLIGLLIGGYLYFHKRNILRVNKVTIELGEKVPTDVEVYVKNKVRNINDYKLNLQSISVDEEGNTDEVGKFSFTVKYENQEKKGTVQVKDTKKPKVSLKSLTVGVNEEFLLNDFIATCEDLSLPCKAEFKNKKDEKVLKEVGTHSIELKISDKYGNYVTAKTNVTVSNTETLLSDKENDLTVIKTDPSYDDYDGTITFKYDHALSEEYLDTLDEYDDYLTLASTDYNEIVEGEVVEQEILTLYNKYNYIVGFAVRLTFADGSVQYVS